MTCIEMFFIRIRTHLAVDIDDLTFMKRSMSLLIEILNGERAGLVAKKTPEA